MKKIIFILSCLVATNSYAETPRSSTAIGAGGAGAATAEAGEVSFLNPASLVHLKGRNLYTSFQKDLWAISIIQNDRQSIMPGALSYFKEKDTQMLSMSFAEFAYRTVSIGISGTYWHANDKVLDRRLTAFNGNIGALWTPIDKLGLAFVAQNVAEIDKDFKTRGILEPSSRAGLNYVFADWFRWRMDFVTSQNNNWDDWTPQTGVESYLNRWVIVRAGVSRPTGLKESWSAGFGLDLPRFRLDYASQWHVEGTDEQRHSVDLAVPF